MDTLSRTAESTHAADELVNIVDGLIAEFEARGWLRAASVGEQLVCEVYAAIGVPVPKQRVALIEKTLGLDLTRRQTT